LEDLLLRKLVKGFHFAIVRRSGGELVRIPGLVTVLALNETEKWDENQRNVADSSTILSDDERNVQF